MGWNIFPLWAGIVMLIAATASIWAVMKRERSTVAIATMTVVEDLLLNWGGEYELLFTVGKDDLDRLYKAEVEFAIIGMVNDGVRPELTNDGERRPIGYGDY